MNDMKNLQVEAYTYSYCVGDKGDKKSTFRYCT